MVMDGQIVIENVSRYRAIASLCRQTAALRPLQKWSLLDQAEGWERLAVEEAYLIVATAWRAITGCELSHAPKRDGSWWTPPDYFIAFASPLCAWVAVAALTGRGASSGRARSFSGRPVAERRSPLGPQSWDRSLTQLTRMPQSIPKHVNSFTTTCARHRIRAAEEQAMTQQPAKRIPQWLTIDV